jgi:hypothetical protein
VEASEVKLPTQEAEKLLAELESIDDQLASFQAEQSAYSAQLRLIGRLLPSANGLGQGAAPGQLPPAKLNPSGWGAVFAWTRQLYERLHQKSRDLEERQRVLQLKRRTVVDKGHKLGGLLRRGGYRVIATLTGSGHAVIDLGYMVSGARWRPTYDLQLQPSQNRVAVSLAGLVSQESGEDWTDARADVVNGDSCHSHPLTQAADLEARRTRAVHSDATAATGIRSTGPSGSPAFTDHRCRSQ